MEVYGEKVYSDTVDFRFYNSETDSFRLVKLGMTLSIVQAEKWEYHLVSEAPNYSFSILISQEMNPSFNYDLGVFIFNHCLADLSGNGTVYSFLLKFKSFEFFELFRKFFFKAIFETVTASHWPKSAQNDRAYMEDAFGKLAIVSDNDTTDDYQDVEDDKEEYDNETIQKIIQGSVRTKESSSSLFVSTDSEDECGDDDEIGGQSQFFNSSHKNSG